MIKDDEVSNQKRAGLQSQQIDEQIALGRRLDRSRHSEDTKVEEFYGPGREALQTEINEITHRLQKRSLKGYLYRQTKGKDDTEALERAKLSLCNLEMRVNERRQGVIQQEVILQEQQVFEHDLQRSSLEATLETELDATVPVSAGSTPGKTGVIIGGHTIPIKRVRGGRTR